MKMPTTQIAGSDLCRDGWRKLSGRLGFVILLLLGTEILANMSKKGRNEQPDPSWHEFTSGHYLATTGHRQTRCVSSRHHESVVQSGGGHQRDGCMVCLSHYRGKKVTHKNTTFRLQPLSRYLQWKTVHNLFLNFQIGP